MFYLSYMVDGWFVLSRKLSWLIIKITKTEKQRQKWRKAFHWYQFTIIFDQYYFSNILQNHSKFWINNNKLKSIAYFENVCPLFLLNNLKIKAYCNINNIEHFIFVTEASVNESCFFNEQCEALNFQTNCQDGRCTCRFEMTPITNKDGTIECKGKFPKSQLHSLLTWFYLNSLYIQENQIFASQNDTLIRPWLEFWLEWH